MSREEYWARVYEQQALAAEGDVDACLKVYEMITDKEVFSDDEVFDNTFLWAEKEHNIFCMLDLAHYYREGKYVDQSFLEYTLWLSKIADGEIAERVIEMLEKDTFDYRLMFFSDAVGAASFELAKWYSHSDDISLLTEAQRYAAAAITCKYPSYPGEYVSMELAAGITERLNKYSITGEELDGINRIDEQDVSFDIVGARILNLLINEMGHSVWNKFQPETQKDILTAEICFQVLSRLSTEIQNEVDFSSVVITLMKALEYELKIRFLYGYCYYLSDEQITVNDYIAKNSLTRNNNRKDPYERGLILQVRNQSVTYASPEKKDFNFTLGSFNYAIGMKPNRRGRGKLWQPFSTPDATAIDYCETCLMDPQLYAKKTGTQWLFQLVNDIDTITELRNKAAHGGKVLSRMSAESAFEDLIRLKKILVNLAADSNSDWIRQTINRKNAGNQSV